MTRTVPVVELRFSALPAHVRTARLVAAAVARRAGVDEASLDEVRLAVGEACSRAVDLHRRQCPDVPVTIALVDEAGRFAVEVTDRAAVSAHDDGTAGKDAFAGLALTEGIGAQGPRVQDTDEDPLPAGVGLAVISGLVDDVQVLPGAQGTSIRMSWRSRDPRAGTIPAPSPGT